MTHMIRACSALIMAALALVVAAAPALAPERSSVRGVWIIASRLGL